MPEPVAVTIYHNPACGTSRNVLALIRNAGIEPTVIEYLKTPLPSLLPVDYRVSGNTTTTPSPRWSSPRMS